MAATDVTASPAAAGQTGNFWNDAVQGVLNLVQGGAAAYNTINGKTNGAAQAVAASQSPTSPAVVSAPNAQGQGLTVLGLTTQQTMFLVLGLGGVLLISVMSRKH